MAGQCFYNFLDMMGYDGWEDIPCDVCMHCDEEEDKESSACVMCEECWEDECMMQGQRCDDTGDCMGVAVCAKADEMEGSEGSGSTEAVFLSKFHAQ